MEVFVYGTLTESDRLDAVLEGTWTDRGPAVLEGCHRVAGAYPTLAPGGRADGRLVATDAVDRLDDYEGVDRGLYVRVAVPRAGGGEAAVYVGDPERLGAEAAWPGAGPLEAQVREYLAANDVLVRPTDDRQG